MTVGNPENFKIKISTGREEVDKRVPCDFSNLTLNKLFAWIDSKNLSSALKSELKRSASAFPHQALPNWQKNFDKHLSKASSRLRKKKNNPTSAPLEQRPLLDKPPALEDIKSRQSFSSKSFAGPSGDFDDTFRDDLGDELEDELEGFDPGIEPTKVSEDVSATESTTDGTNGATREEE